MMLPWRNRHRGEAGGSPSQDSEEALLEKPSSDSDATPISSVRTSRSWTWVWIIIQVCTFGTSVVLFIISGNRFSERNAAFKRVSAYSPFLEDVDAPVNTVQFNGTLWHGEEPSVWRKIEGEDVRAAWAQFETIRPMPMTAEEVIKVGKDLAMTAKLDDDYWGLGDDAYIGTLDFFHQIRCMNTIRKEAFANYKKGGQIVPEREPIHWLHVAHCVDMVMQNLLCAADTGVMTYTWVEGDSEPWPDMNVNRQCKDWRKLLEYRDRKAVDLDKFMRYHKPEGVHERPFPPDVEGVVD